MRLNLEQVAKGGETGEFKDIDVEFCRFLQQTEPGITDAVLTAALLISRAYRNGNVCLHLKEYAGKTFFKSEGRRVPYQIPNLDDWRASLTSSKAVGKAGEFKPIILDDANRLYFHKLWKYEQNLVKQIFKKVEQKRTLAKPKILKDAGKRIFGQSKNGGPDWQKVAAFTALHHNFTVISGGPGTGKTTTVVKLLALMAEQTLTAEGGLSIALTAPTGKAAARMEASIVHTKKNLDCSESVKGKIPAEVTTIHRLLGARRHTSAYKYNRENPLPYDVIIIDEASMIDQALLSKLMDALLDHAQVILLGDKDQLASVEAGSVMGDICGVLHQNSFTPQMAQKLAPFSIEIPTGNISEDARPLNNHIVLLTQNYRFKESSGLGTLTSAINAGNSSKANSILQDASFPEVEKVNIDSYDAFISILTEKLIPHFKRLRAAKSIPEKLDLMGRFQILTAHRTGPWGAEYVNLLIEESMGRQGLIPRYEQWYEGKPIIINRNDYSMNLNNGDVGICSANEAGDKHIYFANDDNVSAFLPARLPEHSTAYVLTVHKSQGSEFDEVIMVLPDRISRVLSRELLYTAVSRAKEFCKIIGSDTVIADTIQKQIKRNSGLKQLLWASKAD